MEIIPSPSKWRTLKLFGHNNCFLLYNSFLDMTEQGHWMTRGRCRGDDPNLFFPLVEDAVHTEQAKKICNSCEVKPECLEWALRNQEIGIWGATTTKERITLRLNARLNLEKIPQLPTQ